MIEVEFPDGRKESFPAGVSGEEIAAAVSPSLARAALAVSLDGELLDLRRPLERGGRVEILTARNPATLELIRHDAAHVLAQAVQELFAGVQVT
ncbi:MAG: TGS domain-containing protein, partial [Caulobacteraceae bacterium]